MRRSAKFNLFLIVIALAAGLGLFVYAGELANRETQAMTREFAGLESRIEFLAREVGRVAKSVPKPDASGKGAPSDATSVLEKVTVAVESLRRDVQNVQKQFFQSDEHERYRLISTVSTRIGAVLMLIFLVQILVGLYRYNMRLAAYYDARADALEVASIGDSGLDVHELHQLTQLWSPDEIRFGKEPQSPIDVAVEAARKALASKKDGK
ncbi:MAG TPA: hypothetical protein VNI54_13540 [Thermoanaerobaculia bacterium]|nr:hypothetical protein [Thermoanaerobaculia bacterium]